MLLCRGDYAIGHAGCQSTVFEPRPLPCVLGSVTAKQLLLLQYLSFTHTHTHTQPQQDCSVKTCQNYTNNNLLQLTSVSPNDRRRDKFILFFFCQAFPSGRWLAGGPGVPHCITALGCLLPCFPCKSTGVSSSSSPLFLLRGRLGRLGPSASHPHRRLRHLHHVLLPVGAALLARRRHHDALQDLPGVPAQLPPHLQLHPLPSAPGQPRRAHLQVIPRKSRQSLPLQFCGERGLWASGGAGSADRPPRCGRHLL